MVTWHIQLHRTKIRPVMTYNVKYSNTNKSMQRLVLKKKKLTNEIWDNATIRKSPSWVLKEGLPIRPIICLSNCVNVVIVSGIKY